MFGIIGFSINSKHPFLRLIRGLKSYLPDRYFQVRFSIATLITWGGLQGSVFGLLLYQVFTADIPVTNDTTFTTFAVDTVIISTKEDPQTASENLQCHLDFLQAWLDKWKIRVNQLKSTQHLQTVTQSGWTLVDYLRFKKTSQLTPSLFAMLMLDSDIYRTANLWIEVLPILFTQSSSPGFNVGLFTRKHTLHI